jgi:D-sedoheptulose 7-phosphate isomerase
MIKTLECRYPLIGIHAMGSFAEQLAALQDSLSRLSLASIEEKLAAAISVCLDAIRSNRPILVCGNGGSAADAQHIAGELVGRFLKERRALNVRALSTDTSVLTAWANDYTFDSVFARQVEAYGAEGGVVFAISTSGNSRNVLLAAEKARDMGMKVVALTGEGGGKLASFADALLAVPSHATPRIQEMHIMLYHYICEQIEAGV